MQRDAMNRAIKPFRDAVAGPVATWTRGCGRSAVGPSVGRGPLILLPMQGFGERACAASAPGGARRAGGRNDPADGARNGPQAQGGFP